MLFAVIMFTVDEKHKTREQYLISYILDEMLLMILLLQLSIFPQGRFKVKASYLLGIRV
jgi:hypothetical protein